MIQPHNYISYSFNHKLNCYHISSGNILISVLCFNSINLDTIMWINLILTYYKGYYKCQKQ